VNAQRLAEDGTNPSLVRQRVERSLFSDPDGKAPPKVFAPWTAPSMESGSPPTPIGHPSAAWSNLPGPEAHKEALPAQRLEGRRKARRRRDRALWSNRLTGMFNDLRQPFEVVGCRGGAEL